MFFWLVPTPLTYERVREVESWVLADRDRFARFIGIRKTLVPVNVDAIDDPKSCLINLARKSRKRNLREDIVSSEGSAAKQGPDYKGRLMSFVEGFWNPYDAMHNSPGLERMMKVVEDFQPVWDRRHDV